MGVCVSENLNLDDCNHFSIKKTYLGCLVAKFECPPNNFPFITPKIPCYLSFVFDMVNPIFLRLCVKQNGTTSFLQPMKGFKKRAC